MAIRLGPTIDKVIIEMNTKATPINKYFLALSRSSLCPIFNCANDALPLTFIINFIVDYCFNI